MAIRRVAVGGAVADAAVEADVVAPAAAVACGRAPIGRYHALTSTTAVHRAAGGEAGQRLQVNRRVGRCSRSSSSSAAVIGRQLRQQRRAEGDPRCAGGVALTALAAARAALAVPMAMLALLQQRTVTVRAHTTQATPCTRRTEETEQRHQRAAGEMAMQGDAGVCGCECGVEGRLFWQSVPK